LEMCERSPEISVEDYVEVKFAVAVGDVALVTKDPLTGFCNGKNRNVERSSCQIGVCQVRLMRELLRASVQLQ
jgi:hypothetical protein